ncbi:DUF4097 family beta strand repeat-containing protein [Streptomyces sp. NPDC102467]|uniref:DUF4097 family beta strand repeat-containing protein n=1 Tax=Streptomyces sp. NPDC102467 TaxID=3366179 RepID=UPI003804640E
MKAATKRSARYVAVGLATIPLLAACGGAGGDGRTPADGAGSAASNLRLTITTDNGVRLRPADDDQVGVDPAVAHHWSRQGRTQVLDLSCKGRDHPDRECPRMPEIDVPAGTSVTVTARNAGIDVAGVSGPLDLTTVNGDVALAGSGRGDATVRLVTRNGSVRATAVHAAALRARTVNGDVTLGSATAPRRLSARTVNGSVDVSVPHDSPAYRVTAATDNGRPMITVPDGGENTGRSGQTDRTMELTTVNGDVRAARD